MALALCLAVACVLRVWASRDDFVIDEIWSYSIARSLSSAWEVFTLICSNSHILNTLYLYLLGPGNETFYRWPSLIAGMLTVLLIVRAARPGGFVVGLIAALLSGLSYPLVVYSAEARGYAVAALFGLLAYLAVRDPQSSSQRWRAPFFWCCMTLGLLAQVSFVIVYASITAWLVYRDFRFSPSRREAVARLIRFNLVPLVLAMVFYVGYVRRLVVFWGEVQPIGHALLSLLALPAGAPEKGGLAVAGAIGGSVVCLSGIWHLWKRGCLEWLLYLCVLFVVPPLSFVAAKTPVIALRFFFVCLPFFYLLVAETLAGWYGHSRVGKVAVLTVVLLFAAGSLSQDINLIKVGRGSYYPALLYMAEQTPGNIVTVASDHDFRNKLIVDFYARHLPTPKQVVYVDHKDIVRGDGPAWLITHELDTGYQPPRELEAKGGKYSLVRSYPYCGISGFSWFVYRRQLTPGVAPRDALGEEGDRS